MEKREFFCLWACFQRVVKHYITNLYEYKFAYNFKITKSFFFFFFGML